MSQTSTNIIPKYRQKTRYNYIKNSGFWVSDRSPLLHYHYVITALTMQIPAETLSQTHRVCFIGKERDSETGFSYFGARYYDSDILTGWLSVDPMADKYPSLSPYAYCGWNPIRLVDPNGEEVADYYDIYGNYLGTDGIADGRIFVVTNEAEIERILDNGSDCSIQFTDANTINDKYELLPQELRKLIIDYLNESYSKQQNREYGGMAILQIDGTIEIGQYEPGPEYQEREWGGSYSANKRIG